ncbi:MAG: type IIA DNA topoisomerase subunit B [Flavobacteriales bacterium]|nr:type IIA DNA topoisomerase subunit B [Flavobacteriales bacterium]
MSENYTEDSIKSLDWKEHIRMRPGMYIGKLGDGSSYDDGIYVLVKEVVDNCIDEFVMGNGKRIEITIKDNKVSVRDFGRGIPLGKVIDCVSKINTGGKYDSKAFKKSVGLNGVGTKAVNALSSYFKVASIREDKCKAVEFTRGEITNNANLEKTKETGGTSIEFIPDEEVFGKFHFVSEYVEKLIWNYAFLNPGLSIIFNGKRYHSKNGLLDLLNENISGATLYPIIHLKGYDIEVAITHGGGYSEEYYSFVNGQHTTQGGSHQAAFRESVVRVIRDFFKKDYDAVDIRSSIIAAVSIKVMEPVFESQTKTKLGSQYVEEGGATIRNFIMDFLKTDLDNFLHKNSDVAEAIQRKILQSERERKDMAGIRKIARERAKNSNLHNKKLRDCRVHYNDPKAERRLESTLFITEGDSASGSITKSRDVNTQGVFSLKGKPLNAYGLTKKIVYENEEFNLVQAALNIEDGLEGLRYNNIVLATDADVDGMHIRLLLITFFLQFFPDLIKNNHLYILQTPLFRCRNKKDTYYCYSDKEKQEALSKLGANPEITRFKGLGEISPDEFKNFIGKDIRLEPVIIGKELSIAEMLSFYMGKNTPDRQMFIIDNLVVEKDIDDEDDEDEEVEKQTDGEDKVEEQLDVA